MGKGDTRIHWLQHVQFEGLACIQPWAHRNSFICTKTAIYKDEPLPVLDDIDLLIVMGGPMNIHEELKYPWLKREKQFISSAINEGKVVLGICLGAQLIVDVLGGNVHRNVEPEIGWFDVNLTPEGSSSFLFRGLPPKFSAFHWHGDTFEIPNNCKHLASSKACVNQAFEYDGRVLGLQFHLESTEDSIGMLTQNCEREIVSGEFIQPKSKIWQSSVQKVARSNKFMDTIMENLITAFS